MDGHHLTDEQMVEALEHLRYPMQRVILGDCRFCGTELVIAGTTRANRARNLLPPTPNRGPWRAFERRRVIPEGGWRSSKRFGFIPAADGQGFAPHRCPKGTMP